MKVRSVVKGCLADGVNPALLEQAVLACVSKRMTLTKELVQGELVARAHVYRNSDHWPDEAPGPVVERPF